MKTAEQIAIEITNSPDIPNDIKILKEWAEEILNEAANDARVRASGRDWVVNKESILDVRNKII